MGSGCWFRPSPSSPHPSRASVPNVMLHDMTSSSLLHHKGLTSAYVQNDVGVTVVELAVEICLPSFDLEFLQINAKITYSFTYRYEAWRVRLHQGSQINALKPNSITLAGSVLAPNMFGASSELASVMEFGF